MNSKRLKRISEEIKKIVSELLKEGLKDPRISMMTSITEVEVTKDLRYAKIYVSILGDENEREETLTGLKNATGFIRKEIGNKLKIRYTPEPIFCLDKSIERGVYISQLLNKIKQEEESKAKVNENGNE
ncbi:ribosome-binding factor A [Caloranaerobacter azorensis DSM 13643]|uniref:Ribosome-binding factor A n=1 Tax=Caloranaerobacter azorensis DSM 13643 TaxID=1121264 RepID=A0A1M5UWU8_9FIRM|nr:30S ribosome-binding factor RbfA [Caloranaerobacter azorensis]SHH67400.1 ribosome-binding factor A [Caloranaerobacter azorensis DSM 13643]